MTNLTPFFTPRGVALIGASATPGKLGYGVLHNLIHHGYQGRIHPIHPTAPTLLGLPCHPDLASVPDPVDLAVIIIPAPLVADVLRACGQRRIPAAIILSGGFAETGPEGQQRQAEIIHIARQHHIRLLGPNCVGILDTHSHLNATFIEQMPDPGAIAFLSQSGAIGGALIDWAKGQGLGLSSFASLGNCADLNETDLIAHLADDPHTRVIALYIEGLPDGRRFLQTARQVTQHKPIVALKAGRTDAGARAVSSHTASLAGSDAVYHAAFRQAGVLLAETTADLFGIALGLAYQPPPPGPRVAILTNAGGPGALAADALSRHGLLVPPPDELTRAALQAALGPAPQLDNPIDLLGAASSPVYETAARILLASDAYDALLALLVPNTANDPVAVADALARTAADQPKPMYVCYMGDISIRAGRQRLHHHRLPPYTFPETAACALAAAWAWQNHLTTPPPSPALPSAPTPTIRPALRRHRAAGATALGETDLYPLLQTLDFPLAPSLLARNPDQAVAHATRLGLPIALKIASPDLLHKSDSGGILLDLDTPAAVRAGYLQLLARVQAARPDARITGVLVQRMAPPGIEVIVGARRDPTFGPTLLFGGGGAYVEAIQDVALRLTPLTHADARALIAETIVGRLLAGARGQPPADIPALADLIVRVADLAHAHPELAEFECNPVIVHPAGYGVTIVDARALLI